MFKILFMKTRSKIRLRCKKVRINDNLCVQLSNWCEVYLIITASNLPKRISYPVKHHDDTIIPVQSKKRDRSEMAPANEWDRCRRRVRELVRRINYHQVILFDVWDVFTHEAISIQYLNSTTNETPFHHVNNRLWWMLMEERDGIKAI